MGPRFLETLIWVAFYLGFLVFAFTYNAASPMYRAIFIEQTATDWLPDATRDYAPPTPILGNEDSPYFAGGWWWADKDGRWGMGERSTLVTLPTRVLARGSRITGRIGALLGGTRPEQTIAIEINGVEVERLLFAVADEVRSFDAPLPAPVGSGEVLEIAFVVPGAQSPLLLQIRDDSRQLGVRFYELAVVPSP